MKQKKEINKWMRSNNSILIFHIIFPMWIVALMYTPGITGVLLFVALGTLLLLELVYKLVQGHNKGHRFLYVARAAAIAAVIAFYMPTLLLMNFSHTKILYPLKRLDYIYGVSTDYGFYERLLPSKLPINCEDYSFRAYGSMPAQDYHPSSYLIFRTDTETLDSYAAHYDDLDCERRKNGTGKDGVQSDIEWVCEQMRLRESYQDNLDHAVLYWFSGTYPKAVLLNYETGLVAIMT